jgi:DNA-binding transcriptional regulator PaaX
VAEGTEAAGQGWLLLIYRVPSEPSRLRSAVWRRLKSLGAVYLQNSAAALPASVGGERALRKLRSEILAMQGTDEYEEIVDRCTDFLAQVEKEHVARHYTFAELEENEVDLDKLQKWFARVRQRDVFGVAGRLTAEKALATCKDVLEGYAAKVFAEEKDVQ